MTESKRIETRIIRQLQQRGLPLAVSGQQAIVAQRTIQILAATACAFLLAAHLQELLWAALAGGTVLTMGR